METLAAAGRTAVQPRPRWILDRRLREEMDEKTSRKICHLIAGVVAADNRIDPAEEQFVDRMLRWFNLFFVKREDLLPIMNVDEAAHELAAMPKEVQEEAFELLVQAAAADREYAPEERVYLHALARVIGVSEEEVTRRVEAAIARIVT